MKKLVIIGVVVLAAVAGIAFYSGMFTNEPAQAAGQGDAASGSAAGGRGGRGGFGGNAGGGFRPPLTVELGVARKENLAQQITVVGNLIGETTVAVVPRTAGRLEAIYVKLGDRVTRGQRIAKIEDQEIVEQVRQAEAAEAVATATIRQREADLKRAETNVERSRNLFQRQLLPRQTLDDNEATYQAALAQLDLARAQTAQSRARLEELRINLANTLIVSPANGFVARRAADPGAFASQNAPVVDVVDISDVRLSASVVERDLAQLRVGNTANVEVDAFPGEDFTGRIARIAPVLDPATRTASVEIQIPNPTFRLKPGMYARVNIATENRKDVIVVPATAVIDLGGRRGVFQVLNDVAIFRAVRVGLEQEDVIEILEGLEEGEEVITTGAGALRDGDRVVLAGADAGGRRGGRPPASSTASPETRPNAAADAPASRGQSTGAGRRSGRDGGDLLKQEAPGTRGQRPGGPAGAPPVNGGGPSTY